GQDQGCPARPRGPCRWYGGRQSPVRRRGHLSLSHGHPVARSTRALRTLEGRSQTVPAMVRKWRFHAGFEIMSRDADNEFVMLDATIVRAHQHSAGAQKKTARIKRSAARVAD